MIAHSGFTSSERIRNGGTQGHIPKNFDEFMSQTLGNIGADLGLKKGANPYDMGVGKNFPGHSLGGPLPGFTESTHFEFVDTKKLPPSPVPAPAALAHLVPMAMHLDHLEATAKAERDFGITIGFIAGSIAGGLLTMYIHHRFG